MRQQISDSLKNVGLSSTTSSLVVVRLTPQSLPLDQVLSQLTSLVEGQLDPRGLDALSDAVTDWEKVKKVHKLMVPPPAPSVGGEKEGEKEWVRRVVESTTGIKAVAG